MVKKMSNNISLLEFECQAPLRFFERCAACARFGDDCLALALGKDILARKKKISLWRWGRRRWDPYQYLQLHGACLLL